MNIIIEKEVEKEFEFDYEKVINDVINYSIDYEKCPYEAEVNVTITDDTEIHRINKEFRDIDRPTDVLSFPMIDYVNPGDFDIVEENVEEYFDPDSGELLLGDIVLSIDKIYSQAEEYGHSIKRELAFLVAHSMLHLFGYDHMEDDERVVMESKQREILENLGITR